ncbi:MAG: DUF1569 domain-containing protein [Bdellovibrionales bacterium]|nr:DUF1569 domain-containing protein [Bdellovibrionales bacterium]
MNRRRLDFQSFDEVLTDVQNLYSLGYEKIGQWSLAENLEHLRRTMESATEPRSFGVPAPIRFLLRLVILPKILKGRRMKSGLQTASGLIPEADRPSSASMDDETERKRFVEAVNTFRNHQGEYLPNPAFGRISRSQWEQLQLVHCSHHLSFLVPK